ncbi:MAG: response regulator [Anaerolineae bacterium]|nr:response regulator [Anaerolineae bacterium]
MSKRLTTSTYKVVDEIAEGSPQSDEAKEPINPLQTTSVPVVKTGVATSPTAETGLIPAVLMAVKNEGTDRKNEAQDSSRTTDETEATPASQKAPDAATTRPSSVLILEDTTELAEVIQATLERMNMVTAHETHGNKALTRFNDMHPDVVLLDIGLPDMTGWKFLEAIKEKHKGQMPVIIVITAYGDPANRLVGKLQGVHEYLIKPFTSDEVERVVTSALKTRTQ